MVAPTLRWDASWYPGSYDSRKFVTLLATMNSDDASLSGADLINGNQSPISSIRAIAIILAHGVVRLHQRQKELDNRTEQSVHDCVLITKGETQ